MRRSREFGFWLLWGLWCLPLWAEVKVIPVFETQAAVQTLRISIRSWGERHG